MSDEKLCFPGSSVVDFDGSLPLSSSFSRIPELQNANLSYKGTELEEYVRKQVLRFVIQLNVFACYLGEVCSHSSCPQMTATKDVLYLCAAHEVAKECCAIDYISHCLDGATSLLTSEDVISKNSSGKPQDVNLQPFRVIMRRLYRLFAHAYFHHVDTFKRFEHQTELFHHFCSFATTFNLISPSDMLVPVDFASAKGSSSDNIQV